MRCAVWLNGVSLGEHPYGYTPYAYALPTTLLAAPGHPNTLAVRVNNSGSNSRWYSGSGLFRPVTWLTHAPLHIAPAHAGGVYVTTPSVKLLNVAGTRADATAAVAISIRNAGALASGPTIVHVAVWEDSTDVVVGKDNRALLSSKLPAARLVARASVAVPSIASGGSTTVHAQLALGAVATWGPEQPALLTAALCLASDDGCGARPPRTANGTTPSRLESFGVRTFRFTATRGLELNGHTIKLRGGCIHHANGPLGSRAIARAEERRVALLKKSGYNAIRTSQCAATPIHAGTHRGRTAPAPATAACSRVVSPHATSCCRLTRRCRASRVTPLAATRPRKLSWTPATAWGSS